MNENTKKALNILNEGGYTLVIFDGETVKTDNRRGIKPLLELAENNVSLKGRSAADKVVGKAAAYLYVILEVSEVYASVISKPALEVLNNYGVSCEYNTLTDFIRNRDNTGFCPMETAVMNAVSPEDALAEIEARLNFQTSRPFPHATRTNCAGSFPSGNDGSRESISLAGLSRAAPLTGIVKGSALND